MHQIAGSEGWETESSSERQFDELYTSSSIAYTTSTSEKRHSWLTSRTLKALHSGHRPLRPDAPVSPQREPVNDLRRSQTIQSFSQSTCASLLHASTSVTECSIGTVNDASPRPAVADKTAPRDDGGLNRSSVYLLPPPTTVTITASAHSWESTRLTMNYNNGIQSPGVNDIVASLAGDDEAARKMAVFKLQTLINDPAYAEHFVLQGGLPRLKTMVLQSSGNTLAYALASFARLLDVDQGWDAVDDEVVQKVVELVVCQPLVNILRGAMAILVSIVSRPYQADRFSQISTRSYPGGFRALKPAIATYPEFLEMLVSRLSSADHALCANALQLINSLMRDAITNDDEAEWPKFIKRIQDLGVIKAVYVLMQSSALQDLAHPLLEFQALTKILLARWKDVPVDLVKPEQRRTIKAIHLSSNPDKSTPETGSSEGRPKHNRRKWRRLGFSSESPEPDFQNMGFLGMMDLSDYVRKHQDEFQHILLEQSQSAEQKACPVARASLAVTAVLFEHFEVESMEMEDSKHYLALESRMNIDKVFKPLLLHWSRLHVTALHAFFRLWKATGAETTDFTKIVDLVRILVESVVGGADRTKGIEEVEGEMAAFEYNKLRELQIELLELSYEDIWGQQLRSVKDELQSEALQFVKEQRVRCLLQGQWFPHTSEPEADPSGPVKETDLAASITTYRFVKLSRDRRFLHWNDFEDQDHEEPAWEALQHRIELSVVSSVVSNVTANELGSTASNSEVLELPAERFAMTKITIYGYVPKGRDHDFQSRTNTHSRNKSKSSNRAAYNESVLLVFQPQNPTIASEWLDGLLMLLNQQPITAETSRLINMVSNYGLKVRLLNVRVNDDEGILAGANGAEAPATPSREGLDDDYYYEI